MVSSLFSLLLRGSHLSWRQTHVYTVPYYERTVRSTGMMGISPTNRNSRSRARLLSPWAPGSSHEHQVPCVLDMRLVTTECLYEPIDEGDQCDLSEKVEVGPPSESLSTLFHSYPQEISDLLCEQHCSRHHDCLGYKSSFTYGLDSDASRNVIIRCWIASQNNLAPYRNVEGRKSQAPACMRKLVDTCTSTNKENLAHEISKRNKCLCQQRQHCIWCDSQPSTIDLPPGKCVCISETFLLEYSEHDLCRAFGYDRSDVAQCHGIVPTARRTSHEMYWSSYEAPAIIVAICLFACCGCWCGLICWCCHSLCGRDRNDRSRALVLSPTNTTSASTSTTAVSAYPLTMGVPFPAGSASIPEAVIVSILPQPSAPPLPTPAMQASTKHPLTY